MSRLLATKLLTLALLALILAFALMQVEWKIHERRTTRDAAQDSIAEQYASQQQLAGPLLWVKCSEPRSETYDDKGVTRQRTVNKDCSRTVRPVRLEGQGSLVVSERYRGIYKARVYLADLGFTARLPALTPKPGQNIEAAYLIFGVADPRGLKRIRITTAQGASLQARPGVPGGPVEKGFHVSLAPALWGNGVELKGEIEMAGSGRLDWAPVAENNDLRLRSTWAHPSFTGQFLPETRDIGPRGFSARWRVNDFAIGGDRMLRSGSRAEDPHRPASWLAPTLGVDLIDPIDAYTQTDRAVRYGFLFVLLTLGGVFLFELLKRRPLHPLQYLLIGFAVVLFFLLLLALSEHIRFALAYLVAAAACVLLIASYGRTLLGSWSGAATLGSGYGLLYAGLYQLLTSEDYALLLGAWLLFALLALTMYLTRRLDWNTVAREGVSG